MLEYYPKTKFGKIEPLRAQDGTVMAYRMTFTTEFLLTAKQLEDMSKETMMETMMETANDMREKCQPDIKQCLREGTDKINEEVKSSGRFPGYPSCYPSRYPSPGSTAVPDLGPGINHPVWSSKEKKYFVLTEKEIATGIKEGNIAYTFETNGSVTYLFVRNDLKLDPNFNVVEECEGKVAYQPVRVANELKTELDFRTVEMMPMDSDGAKNFHKSVNDYFDKTIERMIVGSSIPDPRDVEGPEFGEIKRQATHQKSNIPHDFRPTSKVGLFLQFSADGCGLEGHVVMSRLGHLNPDNVFEMMEPGNLCGAMNKVIRHIDKAAQGALSRGGYTDKFFRDEIEAVLFLTEEHADQIANSEEFRLFCLEFRLPEIEKMGYPHFQERANLRYDAENGRPLKIRTGTPVFQSVAYVVTEKDLLCQ